MNASPPPWIQLAQKIKPKASVVCFSCDHDSIRSELNMMCLTGYIKPLDLIIKRSSKVLVINCCHCYWSLFHVPIFNNDLIFRVQANQRAGRAGRTRPGKCYRLYPSIAYHDDFLDATIPEIQRSSLAGSVLYLKSLDLPDIDILKFDFLDAPSRKQHIYVARACTLFSRMISILENKNNEFLNCCCSWDPGGCFKAAISPWCHRWRWFNYNSWTNHVW